MGVAFLITIYIYKMKSLLFLLFSLTLLISNAQNRIKHKGLHISLTTGYISGPYQVYMEEKDYSSIQTGIELGYTFHLAEFNPNNIHLDLKTTFIGYDYSVNPKWATEILDEEVNSKHGFTFLSPTLQLVKETNNKLIGFQAGFSFYSFKHIYQGNGDGYTDIPIKYQYSEYSQFLYNDLNGEGANYYALPINILYNLGIVYQFKNYYITGDYQFGRIRLESLPGLESYSNESLIVTDDFDALDFKMKKIKISIGLKF